MRRDLRGKGAGRSVVFRFADSGLTTGFGAAAGAFFTGEETLAGARRVVFGFAQNPVLHFGQSNRRPTGSGPGHMSGLVHFGQRMRTTRTGRLAEAPDNFVGFACCAATFVGLPPGASVVGFGNCGPSCVGFAC